MHTRRNRKRNQEGDVPERRQNECHSGLSIAYYSADLMAKIAVIEHEDSDLLLCIQGKVRKDHRGVSKERRFLTHFSTNASKEGLEERRVRKDKNDTENMKRAIDCNALIRILY